MIPGADEYDIDLDIPDAEIRRLSDVTPEDTDPADALTFARNVFVPLTTACRYTCMYCTYYDPPGEAELLSPDEVREIIQRGADAGCTEALFTFGDDPDERYTAIHDQLEVWGHDSIHSYLREVSQIALEEGLLPHSNPGDQTREQMAQIADLNPSMGVMLETTAEVQAHGGPRAKHPGQRLNTIRTAGELEMPFTTGILVGIGEDWADRARSLLAIEAMHERYRHIQEVIVQPVVENDRYSGNTPDTETMRRVVSMARVALSEEISVQVPPNLTNATELLDCGIDDLGGVSPVTADHINPEYAWPALEELKDIAEAGSVPLIERLPVHQRFLPEFDDEPHSNEWIAEPVLEAIDADDDAGQRYRTVIANQQSSPPNEAPTQTD